MAAPCSQWIACSSVRKWRRGGPLNRIVRQHLMLRAIRSFFTAMSAVRRFGRASRLRDKGRNSEALALAQEALQILRRPRVIRTNPAEAAVLSCATVLVEGLAHELKQPGADLRDISDTWQLFIHTGPTPITRLGCPIWSLV